MCILLQPFFQCDRGMAANGSVYSLYFILTILNPCPDRRRWLIRINYTGALWSIVVSRLDLGSDGRGSIPSTAITRHSSSAFSKLKLLCHALWQPLSSLPALVNSASYTFGGRRRGGGVPVVVLRNITSCKAMPIQGSECHGVLQVVAGGQSVTGYYRWSLKENSGFINKLVRGR